MQALDCRLRSRCCRHALLSGPPPAPLLLHASRTRAVCQRHVHTILPAPCSTLYRACCSVPPLSWRLVRTLPRRCASARKWCRRRRQRRGDEPPPPHGQQRAGRAAAAVQQQQRRVLAPCLVLRSEWRASRSGASSRSGWCCSTMESLLSRRPSAACRPAPAQPLRSWRPDRCRSARHVTLRAPCDTAPRPEACSPAEQAPCAWVSGGDAGRGAAKWRPPGAGWVTNRSTPRSSLC